MKLFFRSSSRPIKLDNEQAMRELLENVDCFLVDCDGCCYLDDQPIPGATQTLRRLALLGKTIFFQTNSTKYTREELAGKLNEMGFDCKPQFVFTAAYACALYLKRLKIKGKILVVGEPALARELELIGFNESNIIEASKGMQDPLRVTNYNYEAVVLGMDPRINLTRLTKLCTAVAGLTRKKNFIVANPDKRSATVNRDLLIPDAGGLAALAECCTNRTANLTGKPTKWFWQCLKRTSPTRISASRTAVIGDQYATDLKLAKKNGFKASILVGTGVDTLDAGKRYATRPTHYVEGLREMGRLL